MSKRRKFKPERMEKPTHGIACDASCFDFQNTKTRDGYFHGKVEWQALDLQTGDKVVKSDLYGRGTINLAEYCAIVDSLRYLQESDRLDAVFSDSRIAIEWMTRGLRSKLPPNALTAPILDYARECEEWVLIHKPKNPVLFWSNKEFGENPADFNRKAAFKPEKVYAVRRGRNPGIYMTWAACERQVDGFSGARYKSFKTMGEANAFMLGECTGDCTATSCRYPNC